MQNGIYGAFITIKEAAKFLAISYPRAWYLAKRGDFGLVITISPKNTFVQTEKVQAHKHQKEVK